MVSLHISLHRLNLIPPSIFLTFADVHFILPSVVELRSYQSYILTCMAFRSPTRMIGWSILDMKDDILRFQDEIT
ncbi:hypothetical protein E2C01_096876 [Portunus trituberculatus]|uniref:Uncharacterized protein n=1 Tax=Portunus trituberculatus TaxID=210409 RepID=A0A5B7K424_PORTR|nr:hypothetical protein [Portunus trituberculatus]